MTKSIVRERTFAGLVGRDLPTQVSDVRAEKCTFDRITYGSFGTPRRRIASVEVVQCKSRGPSNLNNALLEDVRVDRWDGSTVWVEGCLMRHVTMVGKCGAFVVQGQWDRQSPKTSLIEAPDEAEHFRDLDWALDISQAEFRALELRHLPARFVRRNPETQMVATLERVRATQLFWKKYVYADEVWPIALQNMMLWNTPERVLVAPVRGKNFAAEIKAMNMLRKKGVLEPD